MNKDVLLFEWIKLDTKIDLKLSMMAYKGGEKAWDTWKDEALQESVWIRSYPLEC